MGDQGGNSLTKAIWHFASDKRDGRRFMDLYWRSLIISGGEEDRLTLEDLTELEDLRALLEAEMLQGLQDGRLIARWHPPGSTSLETVEPTWWHRARIDLRENRAHSHGTTIADVLVFAVVADPPTDDAFARAAEWMSANATKREYSKREAAIAECRQQTGATYRVATAAWDGLPASIKGTRGAKKG
jgi:hypothetical protein